MNVTSKCWGQGTASGRVGGSVSCISLFLI